MMCPLISVVIPAYQAERTIQRAIDSVLAQTLPACEVLVVDDGSPDHQAEVISSYGAPVKLIRQPNRRTAAARNAGIECSVGDFIAFLDADDYWEPTKLESQLSVFDQHPELGIVAGSFFSQTTDGQRSVSSCSKYFGRVVHATGSRAFMLGTQVWTGSVIVRRHLLEHHRFITGLEPAEDRDLWIRLVASSPVFLMHEPLATAVLEEGSISRASIAHDCTQMLKVVQRHRDLLSPFSNLLWKSYIRYRWAALETSPSLAFPQLLSSLLAWPAPFIGMPTMQPLGRLRRLLSIVRQAARSSMPTPARASQ